eukprot:COSAG05_NODE_148_length_16365_cov_76.419218_4_plen_175_part_00
MTVRPAARANATAMHVGLRTNACRKSSSSLHKWADQPIFNHFWHNLLAVSTTVSTTNSTTVKGVLYLTSTAPRKIRDGSIRYKRIAMGGGEWRITNLQYPASRTLLITKQVRLLRAGMDLHKPGQTSTYRNVSTIYADFSSPPVRIYMSIRATYSCDKQTAYRNVNSFDRVCDA